MDHSPAVLDDRTLRSILAVADAGSLRAAARELDIAPSAVQRAVAAAERRLGGILFERGASGARVTELGRAVVRHAHERRDLEVLFAAEVERARAGEVGEARIAVGLGYLEAISTPVLGAFAAAHPHVGLTVRTGGTASMVAALAADEADVAIVLHPAPHREVAVIRSSAQPVGLACSAEHPLVRDHPPGSILAPGDLSGQRFAVMLPGFGLRDLHDEFLRIHGVDAARVLETDSQAVLVSTVARGGAVSLLPPVFLTPAPPGSEIVLLDVADDHLRAVRAAVMVRRGRRLPPAARALVDTCVRWMDAEGVAD